MSLSDFIKRHKVSKMYTYRQYQAEGATIFGWNLTDSIDLNEPMVLSSSSMSKRVSEVDRDWSELEGNTVASLEDYRLYFEALTGSSPSVFLGKWKDDVSSLEDVLKANSEATEGVDLSRIPYRKGEGAFLVSLALLVVDKKRFVRFGRIYKVVINQP